MSVFQISFFIIYTFKIYVTNFNNKSVNSIFRLSIDFLSIYNRLLKSFKRI